MGMMITGNCIHLSTLLVEPGTKRFKSCESTQSSSPNLPTVTAVISTNVYILQGSSVSIYYGQVQLVTNSPSYP
ncbi:Hypothetical predicted protein [Xyrichtys novacula]|uniref:Uncharacterized protein n=1 Tax=Xyrichtys novacula TaxID=13765 RepID=A0AAV1HG98_XYRNO|nr:Hypothetical predicted protein [Xyrichtys novacula]